MTVSLVSPAAADGLVGQTWTIRVQASELPTLVVAPPSGPPDSSILFALDASEPWCPVYAAEYVPALPGRYVAVVSVPGDVTAAQLFSSTISLAGDFPDAAELDIYLGGAGAHSWDVEELTEALAVESAAQRRVCRIPVAYPADLRGALLRRAARYLDVKRQMTQQDTGGDFEVPAGVPLGRDQEIRRLEAPFRKLVTG